MNKTKVGVNVPDVGTPLAVDGKLTRAEGDAVGDALGVAVGVAVAEGLAVNDGKLLPAAAITKLRVTVCCLPVSSVNAIVIVCVPGVNPAGGVQSQLPSGFTVTVPV